MRGWGWEVAGRRRRQHSVNRAPCGLRAPGHVTGVRHEWGCSADLPAAMAGVGPREETQKQAGRPGVGPHRTCVQIAGQGVWASVPRKPCRQHTEWNEPTSHSTRPAPRCGDRAAAFPAGTERFPSPGRRSQGPSHAVRRAGTWTAPLALTGL